MAITSIAKQGKTRPWCKWSGFCHTSQHIDRLVQERRDSSANPWIWLSKSFCAPALGVTTWKLTIKKNGYLDFSRKTPLVYKRKLNTKTAFKCDENSTQRGVSNDSWKAFFAMKTTKILHISTCLLVSVGLDGFYLYLAQEISSIRRFVCASNCVLLHLISRLFKDIFAWVIVTILYDLL